MEWRSFYPGPNRRAVAAATSGRYPRAGEKMHDSGKHGGGDNGRGAGVKSGTLKSRANASDLGGRGTDSLGEKGGFLNYIKYESEK